MSDDYGSGLPCWNTFLCSRGEDCGNVYVDDDYLIGLCVYRELCNGVFDGSDMEYLGGFVEIHCVDFTTYPSN